MRLQLDRHVPGHPVHRRLRRPEDDPVGVGNPGVAGDGHDEAGPAWRHQPGGVPGSDEVRPHADVDHFPVGQRLLPERFRVGQVLGQREGVVHQDVQLALGGDSVEQRGDLLVLCVIDLDRDTPAAPAIALRCRFGDGAGQRIFARCHRAAGDVHRGALLGQRQRDALADATTRAGDHGDPAGQCSHSDSSLPGRHRAKKASL